MITAVGLSPGNQCESPGIPYYLPKPLLVVSKNVRHIDESKVGLTGPVPIPGGFDNQAAYGDIKANVTVPSSPGGEGKQAAALEAAKVAGAELSNAKLMEGFGHSIVPENMTPKADAAINDGLEIDSFFTYQIIFVPDLTQKYGLQISGGAGEFRAAMNMVNGWMYTGMGPFYMKDSSSAQNAMATGVAAMYTGRGVADVVSSVGDLASTFTGQGGGKENALSDQQMQQISEQVQLVRAFEAATPKVPQEMLNFAEVYIYEPELMPDQTTQWRLVAEHHFDRHYLASPDSQQSAKLREELYSNMLRGIMLGNSSSAAKASANQDPSSGNKESSFSDPQGGASEVLPSPDPVEEPDAGADQLDFDLNAAVGNGTSSEVLTKSGWASAKDLTLSSVPQFSDMSAASPNVQVNVGLAGSAGATPQRVKKHDGGIGQFLKNLHHRPTAEYSSGSQEINVKRDN